MPYDLLQVLVSYPRLIDSVGGSVDFFNAWSHWQKQFIFEVVRLNPSSAVQSVTADRPETAIDFFHVSFLALWSSSANFGIPFRDEISSVFTSILERPPEHVPSAVVDFILSLLEYLQLMGVECVPAVALTSAAIAAERHQLFAKSLYFRELEYRETSAQPSSDCVESLIAVNIRVGNVDTAQGLMKTSGSEFVRVRPSWHEKLANFKDALTSYSFRHTQEPENSDWVFGICRCLSALGEWEQLRNFCRNNVSSEGVQFYLASACMHLRELGELSQMQIVPRDFDSCLLAAVAALVARDMQAARELTLKCERYLPAVVSSDIDPPSIPNPFDDPRQYTVFLQQEQLAQMRDLISVVEGVLDAKNFQIKCNNRLLVLDYSLEVWNRLVPPRALVLDPHGEDIDVWIRYSTLARKKQNLTLSERIVEQLENNPKSSLYHGVVLAKIKNVYANNNVGEALRMLESFLADEVGGGTLVYGKNNYSSTIQQLVAHVPVATPKSADSVTSYLISKCYGAASAWVSNPEDPRVLQYLEKSVAYCPTSYKALSAYALGKFQQTQRDDFGKGHHLEHVSAAAIALFKCLTLSPDGKPQLQDILRLISLWFCYFGKKPDLDAVFEDGFQTTPLWVWTTVLPQILARLRTRRQGLLKCIQELVFRIGVDYPQAVAFPLAVSVKSDMEVLAVEARKILEKIKQIHPDLIEACLMVSGELIRISTCWSDQWSTWLEEASRLYFVSNDIGAMVALLKKAHASIEREPETPNERKFFRLYKHELDQAFKWVCQYEGANSNTSIGRKFYLDQAWQIYYSVFLRIHKSVEHVGEFSLSEASPRLHELKGSILTVPGLVFSSKVTIHAFGENIEVLSSKQKPRKIDIMASDGRVFKYLLKGNEDLKQDERVMQLFKLINSIIQSSVLWRRRSGVFPTTPGIETLENFQIKRYAIVPLSNNAGLIEWTPGCVTLHTLIKQRREKLNIPLSIEHNIMRSLYPKYEDLDLFSKIEVFQHCLNQTSGDELRQSMWLNANGAETWCKQRLMYSRSLAVMSIVGYILGLGDRHPSNLMIHESTGQVIHVDFGDCFDVAAMRERYPEKIPFRLTRQLINALEPSGIEGTFRITAERMMDIVRKNADTIMAMLEAFIFDPLITWRLLPNKAGRTNQPTSDSGNLTFHAKQIVRRVHAKLLDGSVTTGGTLECNIPIPAHVDKLIRDATAHENLCTLYLGFCAFW